MTAKMSFVLEEGEGEKVWFYGGGIHTWKATAEQTGGTVSLFEDTLVRGKTTPLHQHPDHEEIVYLIEGEIIVHREEGVRRVGAGTTIVTPRGVPHAFLVISETARLLCLNAPGASEAFYRRASVPVGTGADGTVDFAKIIAAAKETGSTVILGPPPFEPLPP
jgi:quercetin dioxygenase-like cupin family protein